MSWLTDPQAWAGFATLVALETVLGIDNIIFLSILVGKLPAHQQKKGRLLGLSLAMIMRIGLLFSLSWIIRLTAPLFSVAHHEFSGRDLVLILGGLFLLGKSTHEIHDNLEGEGVSTTLKARPSFTSVMIQVMLLDVVFSLDSVITAVGMVEHLSIMVSAVVIAVGLMMLFSAGISAFVERHPTVKMLALSFLLLIGLTLIADGWGQHISKGYIYFAMAFSVFVEMLNLRMRKKSPPHRAVQHPAVGETE